MEAVDNIAKSNLIPHYLPLSCSPGRCHLVFNNCSVPLTRWPWREGLEGNARGVFAWLLQSFSVAEVLQVLGKLSESTCPAKDLLGSALLPSF